MPRVHRHDEGDVEQLQRVLSPRDDVLVAERRIDAGVDSGIDTGPGSEGLAEFEWAAGPFRRYHRAVSWAPAGGSERISIDQEIRYSLAIPYWSRLYDLVVRRALSDGIPAGVRPWWSTPDRLSPQQSTMVAAVTLFNLVAGLLYGLLGQVLTFVAADLGDGSAGQQTTMLAIVRVGVVITVLAMLLADRRGRRRIALWSFVLAAALTLATAASPTWWLFGALQLVARNLAIAGLLCVDTIAIEELPAGSRAMVSGLGALAYGLGAGFIVMSLPLADLGPWGWRLTFVVAGLTLPMIWHARRHLPESDRFVRVDAERRAAPAPSAPAPAPAPVPAVGASPDLPTESRRINGRRFVLVGAIFFLFNVFLAPASQLQNDYLRTERGFSGLTITLFVVLTATPAGLGVLLGGRIADLRGRRAAIVPGLLAYGLFNAIMFSVGGPPMWVASLLSSVLGALSVPAMGVIAPELFPTARRGGVRGVITAIAVVGSVGGLLLAGTMVDAGSYASAFTVLAVAPLAAAALALALPETRGRELEDLNR
ncbi:MAG: MFS transporter [Microthrixaceae bacterium]